MLRAFVTIAARGESVVDGGILHASLSMHCRVRVCIGVMMLPQCNLGSIFIVRCCSGAVQLLESSSCPAYAHCMFYVAHLSCIASKPQFRACFARRVLASLNFMGHAHSPGTSWQLSLLTRTTPCGGVLLGGLPGPVFNSLGSAAPGAVLYTVMTPVCQWNCVFACASYYTAR
jgi:hypothetical protein